MPDTPIFLQNTIFTTFILPFLLIFFIVFAVLQRTKVLGGEKMQINALVAFVIGLIFVAAFNYSGVVNNLVLLVVLAVVIIFVALMIWGFFSGETGFWKPGEGGGLRVILIIIFFIAILIGILWAFGISIGTIGNVLFNQTWSQPFWTNLIFILLIGIALAFVLKSVSGHGK
ncbi:MAG TPA: hypothetical protein VMC07_02015 [Candidatus Omnitrophota bacterium]|nr:hypothetical protein [Candidatus Omnitrophota bacterium]